MLLPFSKLKNPKRTPSFLLALLDRNDDDNNTYNYGYHKSEEINPSVFMLRVLMFRTLIRALELAVPLDILAAAMMMIATVILLVGTGGGVLLTGRFLERVPPLMARGALRRSLLSWIPSGALCGDLVLMIGV